MCRRFDTIPACDEQTDGQTDRRTDGIAVANTALAMRALRAVKMMFITKMPLVGLQHKKLIAILNILCDRGSSQKL